MMNRIQQFTVLVTVDLECIETVDGYEQTLRDHIECSFDEGNYVVTNSFFVELTDEDLQRVVDRYKIAKRLHEVTQ